MIDFNFIPWFEIHFESLDFEADSVGKLQLIGSNRNMAATLEAQSPKVIPINTTEIAEFDAAGLTTRSLKLVKFTFNVDNCRRNDDDESWRQQRSVS